MLVTQELIPSIYEAPLDPKRWEPLAGMLQRAVSAELLLLGLPCAAAERPGRLFCSDPAAGRAMREAMLSPLCAAADTLSVGGVGRIDEQLSSEDPAATSLHRDWLMPRELNVSSGLVGVIDRDAAGRVFLLSAFYGSDADLAEAAHRVREILPHLRGALRLQRRMELLEDDALTRTALLERLALGVMLFDAQQRILYANRSMEIMIARRDGLVRDRDGIRAETPEATAALRRKLWEASRNSVEGGLERPGALCLPRRSARRALAALVVPIARGTRVAPTAVAALVVDDSKSFTHTPRRILMELYDLTPAEAEVARSLAGGLSLESTARTLGVGVETIRSHLKRIFCKTGTGRQASLVRLLVTGPAQILLED